MKNLINKQTAQRLQTLSPESRARVLEAAGRQDFALEQYTERELAG